MHGHVLERRVVLEDEADVARARGRIGHIALADHDLAGVGRLEAGDDPQERRLAAAARTEQRRQRAVVDRDADVVERDEVAEALAHVAHLDRHR